MNTVLGVDVLRKLFKRKPRLEARKAEDRITAVAEAEVRDQPGVEQLFREDPDREVRLAALAKLTDPAVLAMGLDDDDIRDQVAERILRVTPVDDDSGILAHPRVLHVAVASATTIDDANSVLRQISDTDARVAAIMANPAMRIRHGMAQSIWEPAALIVLEKAVRGRDKSLHRTVRDRLAVHKSGLADSKRQNEEADRLRDAAVALRDKDPHYDARRDAIEREWARLLDDMAETNAALAPFGIATHDIESVKGRMPDRRESMPVHAPTEAEPTYEWILDEAQSLMQSLMESPPDQLQAITDIEAKAAALKARWETTADPEPADDALADRFDEAMANIAQQVARARQLENVANDARAFLDKSAQEPDDPDDRPIHAMRTDIEREQRTVADFIARFDRPESPPVPEVLAQLRARQAALAGAHARCAELVQEIERAADAALGELGDLIERGAVPEAIERERQLRDLVDRLPKVEGQRFSAPLQEVGARIRELRDWREYAVRPKRQALCEEMQALADSPLAVQAQAEAVKNLRAQWNALGHSDARRDRELRRQFDRSAERAFEPCRLHFKEQAERRTFNLEQRKTIVAALDDFVANNHWENADWRGVERVLRQARAEWRHYHPVDRKVARELTERFESLASDIHGRLKTEWDSNTALKEAIVREAADVQASSRQATDKAEAIKALQRRWKAVGPLPRRVDQKLWQLFRVECDAVFETGNAARDRYNQRQRAVADANALLGELERRVDIDPSLDRNMITDYERRLHELGDLPNEVRRRADAMLQHADRIAVERQNYRD